MTEKQLHKWETGKMISVDCTIVNIAGKPRILRDIPELEMPLGDLIKAYMEHLRIPWWWRRFDWQYVEKQMRVAMNQLTILWATP